MISQHTEASREKEIISKLWWRLLPMLALGYCIAFMDRGNLSYAALQMNQDLKFSASMYGLGVGLFFVSFSLLEVPSNVVLARVGARRWISRIMLTWGMLAVGMMFVRTPTQFYLMRFLLGAAEAGFFPGVLYYLTLWFPPAYSARAVSRFMFANPLSAVIQGFIAGPLLHLRGLGGLLGWQWLFLVEGTPAILLSIVIFFCLPDSPDRASWLNASERDWLSRRLALDRPSKTANKPGQFRDALRDPFIWTMGACYCLVAASAFAFAFSLPLFLKETLHWDATRSGRLISVSSLAGIAAMILNGWHSDRAHERYYHAAIPATVMAIAAISAAVSKSAVVITPCIVLYIMAVQAHNGVFWAIPSQLLSGRSAVLGIAMIASIGNLGASIGPYVWGLMRDATGSFKVGLLAIGGIYLIVTAILVILQRAVLRRTAQVTAIASI